MFRRDGLTPREGLAVGVFAIQFALNLCWTPGFFGLQRAGLGLVVIAPLWVAIVATIVPFARVSRVAAALVNDPTLLSDRRRFVEGGACP
jgi:tryptophan-rich sensory protein